MGYWVAYSFCNVRIAASRTTDALNAIRALYNPDVIEQFATGTKYDQSNLIGKRYRGASYTQIEAAQTLPEALAGWALVTTQHADGSVEIIEYSADKAGDEAVLFDAIAPFLDYQFTPQIDMFWEDHRFGRYHFVDGKCRRVPGKIVFADECPDAFGSEEVERLIQEIF